MQLLSENTMEVMDVSEVLVSGCITVMTNYDPLLPTCQEYVDIFSSLILVCQMKFGIRPSWEYPADLILTLSLSLLLKM